MTNLDDRQQKALPKPVSNGKCAAVLNYYLLYHAIFLCLCGDVGLISRAWTWGTNCIYLSCIILLPWKLWN